MADKITTPKRVATLNDLNIINPGVLFLYSGYSTAGSEVSVSKNDTIGQVIDYKEFNRYRGNVIVSIYRHVSSIQKVPVGTLIGGPVYDSKTNEIQNPTNDIECFGVCNMNDDTNYNLYNLQMNSCMLQDINVIWSGSNADPIQITFTNEFNFEIIVNVQIRLYYL